MQRDAVATVNADFERYWRRVADYAPDGQTRTFGALPAVSTGSPIFNRVYVFDPPERADLDAAVDWLTDRGQPFSITVADTALAAADPLVADLGFTPAGTLPGMILRDLTAIPEPSDVVDIERVTDDERYAVYHETATAGFELPAEITRQLVPPGMLAAPEMQFFVGFLDGEPVGTGNLMLHDGVAGVYTISVTEPARRQGIGEAMTWAVVRAGRDAGAEVATLQASEMGHSVYERMGFEQVVTYHQFRQA